MMEKTKKKSLNLKLKPKRLKKVKNNYMAKKKVVEEITIIGSNVRYASSTNPNLIPVYNKGIEPLALSPDYGREDLNQLVVTLQDKINEIVKKVN